MPRVFLNCLIMLIFLALPIAYGQQNIKEFSELFRIRQSNKWGYIDKSGRVVVGPQFDEADGYVEGLARIKMERKYGYVDGSGQVAIKPQYSNAREFSEGLACVVVDNQWGYINKTGEMVIKPQFAYVGNFSEGLACVQVGSLWGFIDKTGQVVIKPQFNYAGNFSDGLANVQVEDKWGFINKTGEIAIKPQFQDTFRFLGGFAKVEVDDLWGYIDKTGQVVVKPQFIYAGNFSEGLACVQVSNYRWGYIDKTGVFIIKPQFDYAQDFSEGLAGVQMGRVSGLWGYINKAGEMVIQPRFDNIWPFKDDLAFVRVDEDAFGYIDRKGKFIKFGYQLVFTHEPQQIKANEPMKFTIKIVAFDGRPIHDYEVVHEKLLHMIIVSSDFKDFYHIHPEYQPDGSFIGAQALPAGTYRFWADVRPKGGAGQALSDTFTVGEQPHKWATLTPDNQFTKESEGVQITLDSPHDLKAGEMTMLNYELKDVATGKIVTDLEPYLGAMGHLVIVSEDTKDFLHAHPLGGKPDKHAFEMDMSMMNMNMAPEPGSVMFHTQFPHPGRYKAWPQFKRGGKIVVVSFILDVK